MTIIKTENLKRYYNEGTDIQVNALDGVNIEEAIKKQAVAAAPITQASAPANEKPAEKKEEKKEEKADDSAGAAGLGALFG